MSELDLTFVANHDLLPHSLDIVASCLVRPDTVFHTKSNIRACLVGTQAPSSAYREAGKLYQSPFARRDKTAHS